MPIISVSHKRSAPADLLELLARELPEIVSKALDCPEEPYDRELAPGDVNLQFSPVLADGEGLDYLLEIRTSSTASRQANLQERSDRVKDALEALGLRRFGVWLEIPEAAWSQA